MVGAGLFARPTPCAQEQVIPLIWASIDSTTCRDCLLSLEETYSYNFDYPSEISIANRPTKAHGKSRWKCRPRNRHRRHTAPSFCKTHRCNGRFRSPLTIFLTLATVEERIAAVKSISPSSRSRQTGHEATCFLTRRISTSESSCKA